MADRGLSRRPIRPPPRFVEEFEDVSDRKLLIALQNSLLDQVPQRGHTTRLVVVSRAWRLRALSVVNARATGRW
jgi:hypothetical protein